MGSTMLPQAESAPNAGDRVSRVNNKRQEDKKGNQRDRYPPVARPTSHDHSAGRAAGRASGVGPGVLARAVRKPGHLYHPGCQPEFGQRLHWGVLAWPYWFHGLGGLRHSDPYATATREKALSARSASLACRYSPRRADRRLPGW